MRLIFVNHCHPDCAHICGTRAREFANAMARAGHQVILLTETLGRDDPAMGPDGLAGALEAHDWRAPFRLACRPRPAPLLQKLRAGQLPAAVRKTIVAYQYLIRGGMVTDWRDGSRPYWAALAAAFRPQAVWAVFGNTDAWAIAKGIARLAKCPWVRDFKDEWTGFIPRPFRGWVARRFSDAAASTALSRANADNAAPWFGPKATVVYSGAATTAAASPDSDAFVITLVGAVYDRASLDTVVAGIGRLLDAPKPGRVRVVYVGAEPEIVRLALQPLAQRVDLQVKGQLPFDAYWRQLCGSHVNAYVRLGRAGWWHHKIVELLAARRPILCCPGEIEEARALARSVGGELHEARDAASVARLLADLKRRGLAAAPIGDVGAIEELSWDSRAKALTAVLAAVARTGD